MKEQQRVTARPTGAGEMFQLLRDRKPRTRAELAAITGQARSTIAARIDLLSTLGLVGPAGEATSTGGRPPATFAFRPDARIIIAVDLGATHARLAVTDLASTVLAEDASELNIDDGPDVVLGWVAQVARELVATAGRTLTDVAAIGVGLPGPVEHTTGRPISPPIMPGWDDVDVPGRLQHLLTAVPVLVDNDVNVMALGEHRARWPHETDVLVVKVATGIGAGIIADGALRRGAMGAAGDIGHIPVPRASGVLCRCGNSGCLEAIAGGPAIAAELRAQGLPAESTSDVVALVRAGDVAAGQAVRQAGRDLGAVLTACVSILNPSVIAIGGRLADAGDYLVAGIREVVYQRSIPLMTGHLRIATSPIGTRAAVMGASTMAIDHVLSPAAIEALTA